MSSKAKKLGKGLTSALMFPMEMYTSLVGSLVVSNYIMSEEKPEVKSIVKKWKYLQKHPNKVPLESENFVEECLDLFGMKPKYGMFCECISKWNIIFAPYVNHPLPLREDGVYAKTITDAIKENRVYVVVEEGVKRC